MANKVRPNEDWWLLACMHLLGCKEKKCKACDRIRKSIDADEQMEIAQRQLEGSRKP